MRKHICKNLISFFFLSAFLVLRIADVHSISHFSDSNDDLTDCELCEIITVSNSFTPFINNAFDEIAQKTVIDFPDYKISFGYETSQYSITLPQSVHNKPPPYYFVVVL